MSESLTYRSGGGRLGNRRLYPEPHRRPVAVWNKPERTRWGGGR